MSIQISPESIQQLKDEHNDLSVKLGFPNLTTVTLPPAKGKCHLATYSKVSKRVTTEGHTIWHYEERPLITPPSASRRRRMIVTQKVIEALMAKNISSKFADEIVRVLNNKPKAMTGKRSYHFCGLIPPEFRDLGDFKRRRCQRNIIHWILTAHASDSSILDFDSEQEERLFRLFHLEESYVKEQLELKAYIEKTKAEYDAIENGDLQASDYDAIDTHIQQMVDEMENH